MSDKELLHHAPCLQSSNLETSNSKTTLEKLLNPKNPPSISAAGSIRSIPC